MKKLLNIIILLPIFLVSCVSQKACDKKYPAQTKIKDSVILVYKDSVTIKEETKTILKDSILYTQAVKDSGELDAKENQTYTLKTDKANVKIVIKDGKVKFNIDISATESRYQSKIDSLSSVISTISSKDSISTHSETIVKPAPQNHVPWYAKVWNSIRDFFAWIGLILVLYFAVRFMIKRFFLGGIT